MYSSSDNSVEEQIALQGRKSVQCQLCPVGNNDGSFAYHGGTSSMHENLKGHHYTAFCEATTSNTRDMTVMIVYIHNNGYRFIVV